MKDRSMTPHSPFDIEPGDNIIRRALKRMRFEPKPSGEDTTQQYRDYVRSFNKRDKD